MTTVQSVEIWNLRLPAYDYAPLALAAIVTQAAQHACGVSHRVRCHAYEQWRAQAWRHNHARGRRRYLEPDNAN